MFHFLKKNITTSKGIIEKETKITQFKELFQEKLLYLYKNSDKILTLLCYNDETNLTIVDLSNLLFQNKKLEDIYSYRKFKGYIESSKFDSVSSDNRMECCIGLLDMLYHILDEAFQKVDFDYVEEELENNYEQRLECLIVFITLFENVKKSCSMKKLFEVRESYFDEENFEEIYQLLCAQEQFLSPPLANDYVKFVCHNNAIAINYDVVAFFIREIEQFEFQNIHSYKQKTYSMK